MDTLKYKEAYIKALEEYNAYLLDFIERMNVEGLDPEDVQSFEEFHDLNN